MLCDGRYGIVSATSIERLAEPKTTYNFEVEGCHTYYVGEQGVLVHNKCAFDNYVKDPKSLWGNLLMMLRKHWAMVGQKVLKVQKEPDGNSRTAIKWLLIIPVVVVMWEVTTRFLLAQ